VNPPLARIVTASALLSLALTAAARAAVPTPAFAGTYTSTVAAGDGVRHTIVTIRRDHELTMHTTFSRHTQRPVPMGVTRPVDEAGTWTLQGKTLIFHVKTTTASTEGGDQAPKFADLAFTLEGCVLRATEVGGSPAALEFEKRGCSAL